MAKKPAAKRNIVPIVIPQPLMNRVKAVAEKSTSLSDADVMREAIGKGIGELETFFGVKPQSKAA